MLLNDSKPVIVVRLNALIIYTITIWRQCQVFGAVQRVKSSLDPVLVELMYEAVSSFCRCIGWFAPTSAMFSFCIYTVISSQKNLIEFENEITGIKREVISASFSKLNKIFFGYFDPEFFFR